MNNIAVPIDITIGEHSFTVRRLSNNDFAAMNALEQRSHTHPWQPGNLRSSLESHLCLGLHYQQTCIGYAVMTSVAREAELLLLVLDKPWHGKGIASAFLRQLIELIGSHADNLFLEVRPSNLAAVHLYEAVGFNQIGERPNYYPGVRGQREDALLYGLSL